MIVKFVGTLKARRLPCTGIKYVVTWSSILIQSRGTMFKHLQYVVPTSHHLCERSYLHCVPAKLMMVTCNLARSGIPEIIIPGNYELFM